MRLSPSRSRVAVVVSSLSIIGSMVMGGVWGASTRAATALAVDKQVTSHKSASTTSLASPTFTTSQTSEVIVALIEADGPSGSHTQSVKTVTGGGLTWTLRQRTNTQSGTAEIWQATAPVVLTNVAVTAALASSAPGSITVVTFVGADTSVNGAVGTGNATTGAPTATLTTTRNGSWVWGVGNDWDASQARTVGTNQTKVDEFFISDGGTMWVQRQTSTTPLTGTVVTTNDTAPTNDRWNLSAIEILPVSVDTTPPTAPTNLVANAVAPNQVNLSWTASTDDVGVTGYQVFRDGVQLTTVTATSFYDTTTAPSTSYTYTIKAVDAANNVSQPSNAVTANTPATDTTAPTISSLGASGITQTAATISWSTDEPATTQVEYGLSTAYGASTTLDNSLLLSHSQTLTGLSASTTYHFRVHSTDGSGNAAVSADNSFTTLDPVTDTTPPTVSLTNPANGATVGGSQTVAASASDNVGVVGVQFKLDGANLGAEDSVAPYSVSWDTTTASDGAHTLTAVARDAAGNSTTTPTLNVTVSNGTTSPDIVGQWAAPAAWPEVSVHAALTPTGKVLTIQGDFSSGGQQYLFNPADNSTTQVPNAAADLFCAGQAVLADGRIMIIGGTSTSGGLGIKNITAFDATTETWQNLAPMHYPRWYATGTTLGDGRVLVSSGYNQGSTPSDLVTTPELYSPQTNMWSDASGATQTQPVYPFEYQLPDGRILWAGASETATVTKALDLAAQTWTTIDGNVVDGASIVNYAPGKFMKAGSAADSGNSGPSSSTAFTLDMNQANPTWKPTASMHYPRSFVNLTNLPDGTVLATGGDTEKSGYNDANGVLPAEVWNPATGTWTTVASMTVPRLYHSVALLLPDGRIFVSGGGGDAGVPDHKDYQIYSPSYLFKGARPTISSAPTTVQYNSTTFVGTPDASSIASVSLIRTGSDTHSFDQNARALPLSFSQASGGLNIQMPQNGNYAPPGYYMLFIVNSQGVPSVAAMVRFPAPYEDAIAPTAPTNLVANGSTGTINLTWTAATDNVGVTGYAIYRSTTPNFTANAATKIGTGTATSYTDAGLAAGTYYYQVQAQDAAGNQSPSSNEVTATALADTTAPSVPTNLSATAPNGRQVNLTWTAATDNVGVTGYTVLRDGVVLATVSTTAYSDTSVQPSTTYSYTVTAADAAGNTSAASNTATVTTPAQGATVALDRQVTTHQSTAATTISAPALTTAGGNELLIAFIGSDGPNSPQTISSVSGGGLAWTLRQRTNAQLGTAEIWTAYAPTTLTNVVVTATRGNGTYGGSITVAAFTGADSVVGAVATGNASNGAPTVSLTTSRSGSWVWAVGNDYSNAIARTVGANQTKVDEFLAPTGDTFWVQSMTSPTASAGTLVTINDTAPTSDCWNLSLIEILTAP